MKDLDSKTEELLVGRVGRVMVLTINRPKVKNAINLKVAKAIAESMDWLDCDSSLSAAVITGADANFCAGMDLQSFIDGELPTIEGRGFAGLVESPPEKPLIAAVEGFALAGGFEVALACDLIIAGSGAVFGLPEVKRGLVAGAGGLLRLPELIPKRIAMEMILTGRTISAERAYALGLVNSVVDEGCALSEAVNLAGLIAKNGPLAVQKTKEVINKAADWSRSEMFAEQWKIIEHIFTSQDAMEGATAFKEKRDPVWSGK